MIQASYEQLIERISNISGITVDEIKRKVEAKRARLSGLISLEGAAQIVASELGISFEKQQFKIIDLLMGMKKIQVIGKVLEIYPIRKFSKGDRNGEIASIMLADNTSSIRAVFWDTKHIDMIKNGEIKRDNVIEIKGFSTSIDHFLFNITPDDLYSHKSCFKKNPAGPAERIKQHLIFFHRRKVD